MSRLNISGVRATGLSPVISSPEPTASTYEGGPAFARDPRSELFLLATVDFYGEKTFYEPVSTRDTRLASLVAEVAPTQLDWLARFLPWLRGEANIRTAAIVIALEAVRARLAAGHTGGNRQLVSSVLQRADEPGEALAYWTSRYGRAIPQPVKRGVADAVVRLYNERSALKYDTPSHGFRFGDVIDLVHPSPQMAWQSNLYKWLLDRRHGRDGQDPWEMLTTVEANRRALREGPTGWLEPGRLAEAGMTWEMALSAWGDKVDKRVLWEALIPSMGYMALLRNLRNFDESRVSEQVYEQVARRLADPEQVAKSRQLPIRFLSAYRSVKNVRWHYPLEKALQASIPRVPVLSGRTLVLVDCSASMWNPMSSRSQVLRKDVAGVFGFCLASRALDATLVLFGQDYQVVTVHPGGSLLPSLEQMPNMGGTYTANAIQATYSNHDRVVLVTDEQAYYSQDPSGAVPPSVPLYTWNVAGYRYGNAPSGTRNRHTFGGLTDAAFEAIPLIERGGRADWPF